MIYRERIAEQVFRFKCQHRHLTKRIKKLRRRAGPLIRRLERARQSIAQEPQP